MPATAPQPQGGYNAKSQLPQVFTETLEDGSALTDDQKNSLFAALLSATQGLPSLLNKLGVTTVAVCQKFSLTLAQIKAIGAATSGDVTVYISSPKTVLIDWCIKHTQAFVGPSLTAAVVKLRFGTTPDVSATQDVAAAVADGTFLSNDGTLSLPSSSFATRIVNLNVALTGCNANALTAGTVDVWLTFLVRS